MRRISPVFIPTETKFSGLSNVGLNPGLSFGFGTSRSY